MYYQYYLKKKSIFDEETILSDVSEGLRSKVVQEISYELVEKVRYFQGEDLILVLQGAPRGGSWQGCWHRLGII